MEATKTAGQVAYETYLQGAWNIESRWRRLTPSERIRWEDVARRAARHLDALGPPTERDYSVPPTLRCPAPAVQYLSAEDVEMLDD